MGRRTPSPSAAGETGASPSGSGSTGAICPDRGEGQEARDDLRDVTTCRRGGGPLGWRLGVRQVRDHALGVVEVELVEAHVAHVRQDVESEELLVPVGRALLARRRVVQVERPVGLNPATRPAQVPRNRCPGAVGTSPPTSASAFSVSTSSIGPVDQRDVATT